MQIRIKASKLILISIIINAFCAVLTRDMILAHKIGKEHMLPTATGPKNKQNLIIGILDKFLNHLLMRLQVRGFLSLTLHFYCIFVIFCHAGVQICTFGRGPVGCDCFLGGELGASVLALFAHLVVFSIINY